MNDDETGRVVKRTDLSQEVDTERAVFRHQLGEKTTIKASKSGLEVNSETRPGSVQNKALTTLCLAVAISAITLVAWGIGIVAIAALATGVGTTIALYMLIHLTAGGRGPE